MKMKYIKLTCVFLFAIQICTAFSQSNADYFPWKTGDMWEYTLYYWPDIDTLQTIVIDDSTDEEGNIYTNYFSRGINPIEPPSALLQDTIIYKIDTSLYVYHRYFDFNNGEWINVYRLNGNAGDQWVMWDYNLVGGYGCEMARIDSINDINLFGQNTKLMYMSYFWEYFDGTDTIRLYRYSDQLAKGFGFYFRGAAELDAQIYLHGAVIDSILFGDTTQVITSVNNIQLDNNTEFDFLLLQNYPNPFNSYTKIPIKLSNGGIISLVIYDLLGREVVKLVENQFFPSGYYEFTWNGKNAVSGIYFYELIVDKNRSVRYLVLLK